MVAGGCFVPIVSLVVSMSQVIIRSSQVKGVEMSWSNIVEMSWSNIGEKAAAFIPPSSSLSSL